MGVGADDLDRHALHHLATPDEWARYQRSGEIVPASFAREGFVHCSWGHQVEGTVAKHFAEGGALLALEIDPSHLGEVALVDEDLYGSGQAFPHVYGPIPTEAVVGVVDLRSA